MVLYLNQEDVKQVLDMKTTIEVVEYGSKEMSLKRVEMPTRMYVHFEKYNGVIITMPAYIEALDAAGVKVVTVRARGDFAAPIREGTIKREDIYAELGEIVTGQKKGRTSSEEITLFKATGLAIEDIATAHKVCQLAKKKGIGKEI